MKVLLRIRKSIYNFIMALLKRGFQHLAKQELQEIINFVQPYKKELKGLKILNSLLTLSYFLNMKEEDFKLEIDTNRGAVLIHTTPVHTLKFPIYLHRVLYILIGVYKVPVKYVRDIGGLNLTELTADVIKEILEAHTYEL